MKKIVITTGDPAGCGPFITLKSIYNLRDKNIDFFVVGDKKILQEIPIYEKVKKRFILFDLNTKEIEKIKKGFPSKLTGKAAFNYLKKALQILKKFEIKRLVTAPLSKEATKLVYPNFLGHTEFLANYFGCKKFAMMMVSKKLKVVLFSRHLPLRNVSSKIKMDAYLELFELIYTCLKKMFKIKKPKIATCSFNPHAGIHTFLEKEEEEILKAIKRFKKEIFGPFASDTLFVKENLKKYDCIIACYHDQAMIPFKLLSFKEGVNLTLGLPIIRTSPSHGVAYQVIREGKVPFSSSMQEAIKLALKLNL
jgi:4-hydroxythreonine-4-phosphate dehydrogenase